MTLPREVLIAIGQAVYAAGGGMDDANDLVAVWERLHADPGGRVQRMRYEARTAPCCCCDGGEAAGDGRCARCFGAVGTRERR
jgi:hypothetical protein